jgi:hypothetical protein
MLDMSTIAAGAVTGSYVLRCRAESWLGDRLLSGDIPIIEATEEADRTLRVPERLTFTVPRSYLGIDYAPVTTDAPLAAFGQRVHASVGVELANGAVEWLDRGWFLINSSTVGADTISVECLGLLALVDEARFITEYQPASGATLGDVLRAILEPGVTVNLDDAPAPHSASSVVSWGDNRLDAVLSVLDAWGADGQMDASGTFYVTDAEATPAGPVLALTDSDGGTVIDWAGAGGRDGAFNFVVAKGTYPDGTTNAGAEIIATAYDDDPESPFRYGGDFSPYPVPYIYASPLLTTKAQTQKAARTTLARLKRTASRTLTASAVPHPGLEAGDRVTVTSARLGLTGQLCVIEAISLPYTPGPAMRLTLRTVQI